MDKNTLNSIINFKGDIRSSFDFLMNVYDDIGFAIKTQLRAVSDPFKTYSDSVRSYRQKGLIDPVEKIGVRLILDGRNLLQYLLVQRALFIGVKIINLQDFIQHLPDPDLYNLILKKTLSLNDLPTALVKPKQTKPKSTSTITSELPIVYNLKVSKSAHLLLDATQYSVDEAKHLQERIKYIFNDLKD